MMILTAGLWRSVSRKLVWLITRRSLVQIQPLQPIYECSSFYDVKKFQRFKMTWGLLQNECGCKDCND